jgi:hypothetical protein
VHEVRVIGAPPADIDTPDDYQHALDEAATRGAR